MTEQTHRCSLLLQPCDIKIPWESRSKMQEVIVKVISSHTFSCGSPAPELFTRSSHNGVGTVLAKVKWRWKRRDDDNQKGSWGRLWGQLQCTVMMAGRWWWWWRTHTVLTASDLYLLVCSQAASACTETFLPDTQRQLTVKGNKARQTLRCDVSAGGFMDCQWTIRICALLSKNQQYVQWDAFSPP